MENKSHLSCYLVMEIVLVLFDQFLTHLSSEVSAASKAVKSIDTYRSVNTDGIKNTKAIEKKFSVKASGQSLFSCLKVMYPILCASY